MLKAHKNLNKEQVKDIMKYQISLVIDELPRLIPNLPMPNPMDVKSFVLGILLNIFVA